MRHFLIILALILAPVPAYAGLWGSDASISTTEDPNIIKIKPGEDGITSKIIKSIYEGLDRAVWDKMYPNLVKPVQKILSIFTVLWLIFYSLQSYFGQPLKYGLIIKQLGVILIIYYFLGTDENVVIAWSYNWLINTFYGFSAWALDIFAENTNIFEMLNKTNPTSIDKIYATINSIESTLRKILTFSGIIYDTYNTGITDIAGALKGGFLAVVLIMVFGFFLLYFTFIFAYSLFALHVYFALMPIMLAFFPFKTTRPTFTQWIKSIFNYLTIPVLASIALGITMSFMSDSINSMTAYLNQEEPDKSILMDIYIPLVVVGFISYMILLRVSDMASHLTGGASSGLGADFTRTINMFANTTTAVSTGVVATGIASKDLGSEALRGAKAGVDITKDRLARLKGI